MGTYTNQAAAVVDPGPSADRRRKVGREVTELVLSRAEHLPAEDLMLLRAFYADGRTSAELAPLLGTSARSVMRRARRLTVRVLSDLYLFVIRNRHSWGRLNRKVATLIIVEGRSRRDAAAKLGISDYVVRRHHDAVVAMFGTHTGAGGTDDAAHQ